TFAASRLLRTTRAYRVATLQPAGPPLGAAGRVVNAAFSPDGRSVALLGGPPEGASSEAKELVVWDWASGRRIWGATLPSEPRGLSYRPDSARLAVLCGGGELLLFDANDGREDLRWRA